MQTMKTIKQFFILLLLPKVFLSFFCLWLPLCILTKYRIKCQRPKVTTNDSSSSNNKDNKTNNLKSYIVNRK